MYYSRYRAPADRMSLPRRFPLGDGIPYTVTMEMVPRYP